MGREQRNLEEATHVTRKGSLRQLQLCSHRWEVPSTPGHQEGHSMPREPPFFQSMFRVRCKGYLQVEPAPSADQSPMSAPPTTALQKGRGQFPCTLNSAPTPHSAPNATGNIFKEEKGRAREFQEANSLHIWNSFTRTSEFQVPLTFYSSCGVLPGDGPGPASGPVTTCCLMQARHLDP